MKTAMLEQYMEDKNEALRVAENAIQDVMYRERSLCIAIIQDKMDQIRENIEADEIPTDWQKGQLAMATRCIVSLDHSRTWTSLQRPTNRKEE